MVNKDKYIYLYNGYIWYNGSRSIRSEQAYSSLWVQLVINVVIVWYLVLASTVSYAVVTVMNMQVFARETRARGSRQTLCVRAFSLTRTCCRHKLLCSESDMKQNISNALFITSVKCFNKHSKNSCVICNQLVKRDTCAP